MVIGLVIAGVVAIVAALIYIAHKAETARTTQFQTVADQLGLQFSPLGDADVQGSLSHLRLFNQGHGRKMQNMISGRTEDIDLAIFGYRFVTGGGKNQQTHRQTVISFQSPHLSLPEFELRPEHIFHKIGQAFGYKDIDFDSHPEFSRHYLLRGPDETAIRKFFTEEVLTLLGAQQGLSIEAAGDRLIYYRAGQRIKPEAVRGFMEEGFRIYGAMKRT